MAKQNLVGILLLVLGFILAIAGMIIFLPLGWIMVLGGVVLIVYGRDLRVGVTGSFTEHLSGKKFREHKKANK
jgi:hypothetical protein